MAVGEETSRSITLSWKLHPVQREAFEADARYRTCAWGRRTGKNIFANADQIDYALNPRESPWGADDAPTCWWVGPTYNQAEKYGFQTALEFIPDQLLDGDPKRSEPYEIHFQNGAVIEYRTFDHPDSLDGAGVDHLVIDEAAIMPETIWHQNLRPMLSDTLGQAIFISKPKGQNWFHDFYRRGESDDWPDWWSSQAASYVNPFVPDSEIDSAARELPDRIFKQEYLAIFHADEGGVFRKVRERAVEDYDWEARTGNPPYTTGVDFARWQNWTVITTLDESQRLVHFDRLQETTWDRIQKKIEAVYARYPGPVRLDASRDEKIVEDLQQEGIPTEAVSFGPAKKRELIDNLAVMIENGELTIPDIPVLVNELQLFEYEIKQKTVSYQAPPGWNDDCVDSLALAAKDTDTRRRSTWGSGAAGRQHPT